MLLACKDESRHCMSIEARKHIVMLTVAIWSTALWNVFKVLTSEEIPLAKLIVLSIGLTPDTAVWASGARVFILELTSIAASSALAASVSVTPGVLSWSDGGSWFVQIRFWTESTWHKREDLGRIRFRCSGPDI